MDELTTDNFQFEAGTVYDMCGIPIYRKYPNRVYIAKGKKYVSTNRCEQLLCLGWRLNRITYMKKIILLFLLLHTLTMPAQIIYADYSDPDVCEGTAGDYWLTASSFQCTPGLPILHSTDLVHWELVNYAVERLLPIEHYNTVQHGCGVWAPSIRRHNDTYYIYGATRILACSW